MPRYFIEISYKGTAYAGFQKQENAHTIQEELENALRVFYRSAFELTGSSRTDAGVHAAQNFFHFDTSALSGRDFKKDIYHLNAILPADIVVKSLFQVADNAHCRFDANWRRYQYTIYQQKDAFLTDRAYFFPYKPNLGVMQEAAKLVLGIHDFASFAKKNTQVQHFQCTIYECIWEEKEGVLLFKIRANRFLRGMVRALVATMLRVGTGKLALDQFSGLLSSEKTVPALFDAPAQGLMLMEVNFGKGELPA